MLRSSAKAVGGGGIVPRVLLDIANTGTSVKVPPMIGSGGISVHQQARPVDRLRSRRRSGHIGQHHACILVS